MIDRDFKDLLTKYGVWFLVFLFGGIYSLYSVVRHLRFESLSYDLGTYDQLIWLASRGKPLYSSFMELHFFGDHLTPSLVLLAPLYWLWDNVIILLIFQSFFATLGAVPIYWLAKKKTKDEVFSLVIALAYICFFGIQNAITYDFHPIVLATTLLAWLFFFYENNKRLLFWLILIIFLGLQENFALFTIALGIYLAARYRDFKKGIALAALGTVWFLLAVFVIIPHFSQASYIYLPYHLTKMSFLEIIKMMIYPWTKAKVMIASLLSFGFLPLLSPAIFILLFEEFFQRFVGSPFPARWCVGYHYNSILVPVLAMGAIEAFKKNFSRKRSLAIIIIFIGIFLTQKLTAPATEKLLTRKFYDFSRVKDIKVILSLIPKDASVAATNNLGPHLSHRQQLILLTNCIEDKTLWVDQTKRCFKMNPDYLVADLNLNLELVPYYPDYSREKISRYFDYLEKTGEFKLLKTQESIFLLKRTN